MGICATDPASGVPGSPRRITSYLRPHGEPPVVRVAPVVTMGIAAALFAINALKGKFLLALLAFVPVLFWLAVAGAIRLARPKSWWARRYYDADKLDAAEDRFRPLEEKGRGTLGTGLDFECRQCGELFDDRDLALYHVRQYHGGIFSAPEAGVIDKGSPDSR